MIAKLLEMSRNTVLKYWNMSSFLPKVGKKRNNLLDYEDYLIQRWNEGEQNVRNLYAEIREKGFKYQIRSVYELIQRYPKTIVNVIPEFVKVKYYSSKQLSIWLGTFRKDWSDELPKAYLAKLINDNPTIRKVRNAVLNFKRFMKDKTGEKLVPWCKNIIDDEAEHIKRFARGILMRAAFRTIKQFIKDLSLIGVMGLSKAKSTDSKQLSDRCTDVRVLNYLENEWS